MPTQRPARLPILVYHQVDDVPANCWYPENYVRPAQFGAQLALLRRAGYSTVTFQQYLAARRGEATLPARPVIITFDDAYTSVHARAWPLLRAHAMTATVFVVAAQVGGTNAWDAQAAPERLLSAEEIHAMQDGGIEFQSHTQTHARLPTLTRAVMREELLASRESLQSLLGAPVNVIAYPYGAHSAEVAEVAREVGYEAGVVTRRRLNDASTNLLALRRIPVSFRTSLARFGWDLFRLRFHHD